MADPIAWIGIAISVPAAAGAAYSIWRTASQDRKLRRIDMRLAIDEIASTWRSSTVSRPEYALRDTEWNLLLDSVERWRRWLATRQPRLLDRSSATKTRSYLLVDELLTAAFAFEAEARPLVADWKSGKSPLDYPKWNENINNLQNKTSPIIDQLENMS